MTDPAAAPAPFSRGPLLAAAMLVAAVILAYWNSLTVPLIFDDFRAVTANPTIRQFRTALTPPTDGSATTSRPLVNLTLAVNHAISGEETWSYHGLNILIHAAATLALFGLARRTLTNPAVPARLAASAEPAAFVLALLWALHPLQTESVTCIAQRTESLCGLFYLATVYGLARAATAPRGWIWSAGSVLACLAGMATKEVMVTAPVLALLYDRTFLAGSFAAAWRRRRGYYLALAATWLLLAWLVLGSGGTRGEAAGLNLGVTPWAYLLTQGKALLLYLKLSVWPHPLVIDYGEGVVASWREVWWQGPVVLALLAGTGWALWRRPALGFLGAWFFVILAPSSSVVPLVSQTIAEHRMYLPLASVLALALGVAALRLGPRTLLAAGLGLALAAGLATRQRNEIYRNERALWEDVIAHRPAHGRAHNNLGRVHFQEGRPEEAVASYRESLRLEPGNSYTHHNLGLALQQLNRLAEAEAPFTEAVRLDPTLLSARLNLGIVLTKLGRPAEALPHFAEALQLGFRQGEIHFHWGVALAQLGRFPEAATHYAECLRLNPRHVEALGNRGTVLLAQKSVPEAIECFEAALRLQPDLPEMHFNLGLACSALDRRDEAIRHYTEAVRLDPAHATARLNLGIALAQAGRLPEAIACLEEVVRLQPASPEAHANLGVALGLADRPADALAAFQAALRLRPGDAQAQYNVGHGLLEAGRWTEARPYFEEALRLRPDFPAARDILRRLQELAPR
jgi:tetratricopeptide (TPR) repeat protein